MPVRGKTTLKPWSQLGGRPGCFSGRKVPSELPDLIAVLIEDRELELTVPPKLRHVEEEASVALRKL
jgi:hypothetical protein